MMQTRPLLTSAAILIALLTSPLLADVQPTARGVVIDTDRLRAEIVDGAVVELTNKLTKESYLRRTTDVQALSRQVPSGLGTVDGEEARKSAFTLFQWPWNEMGEEFKLPSQHAPSPKSKVEFKPAGKGGTLTYTNLSNGSADFADETFEIAIDIEEGTGDLLLTPAAASPRAGVYGTSLLVAPTRKLISIETPIFDGVRLTGDMKTNLWINQSPAHWDYPLIAFNGEETGAIGVWAQDPERRYKSLFYLADGKSIATAFCTLENPPFFTLKNSKSTTWHVQAFDKSWSQVADRYRQWRDKNLKIAPRPDWTKQISFVNGGVNTSKGWLDALLNYLENRHPERTTTFLPVIRAASFDTKHYDNRPYPTFKDETPAWKKAGAKTMAYLQPMIMWGPFPNDMTAEDKKVVQMSTEAETRGAFTTPPAKQDYIDQHHLGHAAWQAWFLNWVKTYIQDCGADGVYHDQSYPTPIDGRGLINGMNSPQGMADYFLKAATQNPNSIHGTEHMQEANITGASLGIGSGVLWGPAPTMRMQRIHNGSPMSNALHHPLGVIFAFPHFSDLGTRNDAHFFHWGVDIMERRGDLAGLALQNTHFYDGKLIPFTKWANEARFDRVRSMTFIDMGLRPVFPLDWDRSVRSYFRGADGQDVRYENTAFGSEFVEYKGKDAKERRVIHGRIYGVTHAATPLGIAGWCFYNERGPAGLNPERYYVTDPDAKRPAAYFAPGFSMVPGAPIIPTLYESYVEDCTGNEEFLTLHVKPLASVGKITGSDKVLLHAPAAPAAIYVNGQITKPTPKGEGVYEIGFATPADIVVFLKQPPAGLEALAPRALARFISSNGSDLVDTQWLSQSVKSDEAVKMPNVRITAGIGTPGVVKGQLHVSLLSASDKPETFTLRLPQGSVGHRDQRPDAAHARDAAGPHAQARPADAGDADRRTGIVGRV